MDSNRFKYILWGTGERCKLLIKVIGVDNIECFIDSDVSKQGTYFEGKRIISFEEYCNSFEKYFIIVTPVDEEEIVNLLVERGIYSFFRMSECPSEIQGYGKQRFYEDLEERIEFSKKIVLVGLNLYSMILYQKWHKQCEIYICDSGYDANKKRRVSEYYGIDVIDNTECADIILLATRWYNREKICWDRTCIDIFDMSDIISDYYNPKLEQFKGIHMGERCFIVATGPSLSVEDLRCIKQNKEISFGVNRVFMIDEKIWVPDYYLFNDRKGMLDFEKEIKNYRAGHKFIGDAVEEHFTEILNDGSTDVIHSVTGDSYPLLPKFSCDISRKVYNHATVTYAAIQLAVYMGFRCIFLLGVDCNYVNNSKDNYFFEDKEDKLNHHENRMIMAYQSAKKFADMNGIKIYNATRGGMLEVFERVSFDDLFDGRL